MSIKMLFLAEIMKNWCTRAVQKIAQFYRVVWGYSGSGAIPVEGLFWFFGSKMSLVLKNPSKIAKSCSRLQIVHKNGLFMFSLHMHIRVSQMSPRVSQFFETWNVIGERIVNIYLKTCWRNSGMYSIFCYQLFHF